VIVPLQPRLLQLVRNPRFRVWSSAAKPDGYPDQITVRLGVNPKAGVRAVEDGNADYVFGPPPRAELDALYTRYAGQVHTNPLLGVFWFFLNTRVAPFDNLDARRALNYAIDRRAAIDVVGGAHFARPTCQVLPPGFEGYGTYCPYTANAGRGRPWSAPDLAKARRLISRSRTRGAHVTVWATNGVLGAEARFLVPVLNRLGYRASLRVLPLSHYFRYISDSRHHAQVGPVFYSVDYPAPRDFLELLHSCRSFTPADPMNLNWSEFCDPGADRLMDRAQRLQVTDPASANALWARADRRIVDQAAVLAVDNPQSVDVVSRRVGNYQFSPLWGVLLDQLWLH
jgi:peptide/nickel transport system substrate-binding protein